MDISYAYIRASNKLLILPNFENSVGAQLEILYSTKLNKKTSL
jgi:hypothetical protein